MAVTPARVTVTNSATRLDVTAEADVVPGTTQPRGDGTSLLVRNTDATVSVYVGGATVTSSTGFELKAGESIPVDLKAGDAIYAITATGSVVCHVLQVGV